MADPLRRRSPRGRLHALDDRSMSRPRDAAELDAVVRDVATRVDRLERELADLRGLLEQMTAPVGSSAQIR